LASFANNRQYEKDLLETTGYSGVVRYHLGDNWRVRVAGDASRVDHSLTARQFDNARYNGASAGLEYQAGSGSVLGWDYRVAKGRFPDVAVTPSARDYKDGSAIMRATYVLSVKTSLDGSVGYVRRSLDLDPASDYSGSTWSLGAKWLPNVKTSVALKGWRQLQANQDAESDYFVATGGSATITWAASEAWLLSLAGSSDTRNYRLASGVVANTGLRRDEVQTFNAGLTYSPRAWLQLSAGYSLEQRDSNRPEWVYDDHITQFGLTLTF
jgi:hypothetical protein